MFCIILCLCISLSYQNMKKNNDTTSAFLIHLSAFLGYIIPFGAIIIPLVLWQSQKDKSDFLDKHGKAVVNFNISFALYEVSLIIAIILTFLGYLFTQGSILFVIIIALFILFHIIRAILIILAAIKAQKGETYEYPMTIKFIK